MIKVDLIRRRKYNSLIIKIVIDQIGIGVDRFFEEF